MGQWFCSSLSLARIFSPPSLSFLHNVVFLESKNESEPTYTQQHFLYLIDGMLLHCKIHRKSHENRNRNFDSVFFFEQKLVADT